MTAFTIQDVSRRSGLSEPTLRYYEEVGLIGPIERDPSSRHRRYRDEDLDTLQALACLRAMGVGIEDMRTYKDNRVRGHESAGEQRDLLLRHVERIEAEIETLRTHLDYLRAKAALWDARDRGDTQRFGVADVRDVADLHIRAMATPEAAGKRFLALADGPTISYLQLAEILRDRLGPLAERVPTEEAPGDELPDLVIHNDRARNELGWRPRPAETTIVETAESLRDLGLLDQHQ